MRRRRGHFHSLGLVSVSAALLTLGTLPLEAFAESMPSTPDRAVDAFVLTSDRLGPAKKPPVPTPSPSPAPTPSPTAAPTWSPSPTSGVSAEPSGPGTISGSVSDSAPVTPQRERLGDSIVGKNALDDGESVQGRTSSFIESLASILQNLVSTEDTAVRAAERTSLCPGSACGSILNAIGTKPALVLICVVLLVAGALAFRVWRRRTNIAAYARTSERDG